MLLPEVCGLTLNVSPGEILEWAGGWRLLIPTLLLWNDILSSLLFVPHDF